MHVGVDSFVSTVTDPATGRVVGPEERIEHLLEEIALADASGLYSFGIGEHHREEYYDSAPPVILGAAAAARPSRIRLGSAVTVLSAADPVRVFQQFATLDLISKGRIDLVVGRGSFTEAFPLFGLDLRRLRHAVRREARPAAEDPGLGARHLVRPAPAAAHRPGRLPAARSAAAADLGRRGRHARVVRPGRIARAAADGRHHRRRAAPVRPAGRPLPPRRRPGRSRPGGPEGGPARVRLRRRQRQVRRRHHLPRVARDVHEGVPGARLPGTEPRAVRRHQRPGRRVLPGRPATPSPPSCDGSRSSSVGWTGSRCR